MAQKPTLGISQEVQVAQTRTFLASALPLTMKLAWSRRATIAPLLQQSPERWPFLDRVLCWLVPTQLENVVRFHDFDGSSLNELWSPEALTRLDVHYCRRLAKRIEGHQAAWTTAGSPEATSIGASDDA